MIEEPKQRAQPVGLIETMQADRGHIAFLATHLARLAASAEAFGYPFDRDDAARIIEAHVALRAAEGTWRVTLTLWPDGTPDLRFVPLDDAPFRTALVYPEPLTEAGTWRCRFKTTERDHYEYPLRWAQERGADEAILLNARGEVMDGTRSTVWVRRGEVMLTPPLSAGGLPGVFRHRYLQSAPTVREATLTIDDLRTADEVCLSNALRRMMPVTLLALEDGGTVARNG